ncbi:N(6)-adenine-specific methyltransferase METTL4 [Boleophthalmus pectinirostris]|uniref:N(6)-adenine-specific methyltransferase METTL4 n=1 Tax=Boleophthalmus pectinirostris TaxID=150288 RepID=UPI00243308E8|nr:N(6)-adenine-specific methyltransferase METTL4 [Boleophthalmus pectinirostris]
MVSMRPVDVWDNTTTPAQGTEAVIMAVVAQNASGWVLDARSLFAQSYSRCIWGTGGHKTLVTCTFKSQCFQTERSHVSDKGEAGRAGNVDVISTRHDKKRKRKCTELNQGEIDIKAFHDKVRSVILEGTLALVNSARACGYLNTPEECTQDLGTLPECALSDLCEMAKQLPLVDIEKQDTVAQALEGSSTFHLDLFSRVTENRSDTAAVVTLLGEEYVIPAQSAFLLSDFTRVQPLVSYGAKFDLIVIDPPWENKSVKRSRRYNALPSSQLKNLPVPLLASSDCLIVTWVTNRPSHLRFVRDELYPHWGVEVLAEWLWVKVTTSGQFVFPLDSKHKKTYEVLVLGRFSFTGNRSESTSSESILIEDHRLIVSVPSTLHSQKPQLSEVLKPYIRPSAKCLELFARNLHPGWTSWGNEVLKFQHVSYFTMTPADADAKFPT